MSFQSDDLETALEISRAEAAAIVRYRKTQSDFKSIDDLKRVPDFNIGKIESKKDRIVF